MRKLVVVVVASGALTGALGAGPAVATPADVATDIAREVMSPFCPGVTLHDCPSEAASDLRARIERWARAGTGRAGIMARLRAEYGRAISATPPRSGAGWIAWLLPAAALAAGGAAAAAFARRSTRRGDTTDASHRPPSPEERARLEERLHALRESP